MRFLTSITVSLTMLAICGSGILAVDAPPPFTPKFEVDLNSVSELQKAVKDADGKPVTPKDEVKRILAAYANMDLDALYDIMTPECRTKTFPTASTREQCLKFGESMKAMKAQAGFTLVQFSSLRVLKRDFPVEVEIDLESTRNGNVIKETLKVSVVMVDGVPRIDSFRSANGPD